MNEQIEEAVRAAMMRAYNLGQTYWQQADSEYTSQHKKADVTAGRFIELSDETCASVVAAIASQAPRQALTDADVLSLWEIVRDKGGYSSMMFVTDAGIAAFARAIIAASGPNAALVAALQAIVAKYQGGQMVGGCAEIDAARAALAAVGVGP